jgi:hypothetical protein
LKGEKMSRNDVMQRVLPTMKDEKTKSTYPPHTTSAFGSTNRPKGSTNPHTGVDFNYVGCQEARVNTSHPALRSPVTGVVTNAGQGDYGTIAIRDSDGFSHELLHTHSRHVVVGDRVFAGQLIGTMGNTGVLKRGIESGAFHVHYQLRDPNGKIIDPSTHRDRQGPIDPAVFLKDYLDYQDTRNATIGKASSNVPAGGPLYGPRPADASRSNLAAPGSSSPATGPVCILRSRAASDRAVDLPPTIPNELPLSDRAPSFDDRFGAWASAGGSSAPLSPYQQFSWPPQPGKSPGIVTGQAMPDYPFPPQSLDGATPGLEDWAALRRKAADWSK